MREVAFSKLAEADLQAIDEYTESTWGVRQADAYLDKIQSCCNRLARNPGMGRTWKRSDPELRRIEHGSHVIFYRRTLRGIVILRVLHQSMLPDLQNYDESL